MNIVQASGWYYPDSLGGTEVYVAALASEFQAAGHHVAIAAPEPGASAPRTYTHEGCDVFRYPIPATPTRDEAQGRSPVRGADAFHRWLAASRADVVHFHTFVTGLGLDEIAAARTHARCVVATTHSSSLGFLCQRGTLMLNGRTICDGIVDDERCAACELEHRGVSLRTAARIAHMPLALSRAANALPGRAGTALAMRGLIAHNRARQQRMFAMLDRFVVLTRRAADIVLANGAPREKVIVNRLGISQDVAPHRRNEARRTAATPIRAGYVGRFDVIKGVDDLASALELVPADLPLRCEFRGPAGAPRDRGVRDALQRRLSGDARVSFGNAVPTASMPSLLESYDVVCCPSRCLEGGPTVGLEAMAAGTPVIAADAGGLAEVIEDGVSGRLVPPGDVGALAGALAEVARDAAGTIELWRSRLPASRTMREVAGDYLSMYADCV